MIPFRCTYFYFVVLLLGNVLTTPNAVSARVALVHEQKDVNDGPSPATTFRASRISHHSGHTLASPIQETDFRLSGVSGRPSPDVFVDADIASRQLTDEELQRLKHRYGKAQEAQTRAKDAHLDAQRKHLRAAGTHDELAASFLPNSPDFWEHTFAAKKHRLRAESHHTIAQKHQVKAVVYRNSMETANHGGSYGPAASKAYHASLNRAWQSRQRAGKSSALAIGSHTHGTKALDLLLVHVPGREGEAEAERQASLAHVPIQ